MLKLSKLKQQVIDKNRPIRLLAINVSPKEHGHTARLLNLFLDEAEKFGAHTSLVELTRQHIEHFSGKLNTKLEHLSHLQQKIVQSDGFVIATPTYWFNEPGILKDFIDNLTPLEEHGFMLEGKVAGLIVYSPQGGEYGVLANMALTFNHMGVMFPPYSMIFYRGEQDDWTHEDCKLLAHSIVQQVKAQRSTSFNWDLKKL